MNKSLLPVLAVLVALALDTCGATNLPSATLSIGDAAPPLKVSKWVKGSPVTGFDSNQIYVVSFWATWCGPCRTSIPHLTELAHKFKQVTFIGMDVMETSADKDAAVAKFVNEMGDKMDCHVAMDTEDAFMAEKWMKAAGLGGIPAAFLVQQGKIAWIGQPMGALGASLGAVIAGKFDVENAREHFEAEKKIEAFFDKAVKGGNEAELLQEGKELEALDQHLGGILPNGEKFDTQDVIKRAKFQVAMRAYQTAVLAGKEGEETAKLEAAARAVVPDNVDFDSLKGRLIQYQGSKKATDVFKQYAAAVGEHGDKDKAMEFARQLVDLHLKDPVMLNEFAWTILTDESIKQRDLPLATKLADDAVLASGAQNPACLDTYARALFDSGKIADAIMYVTKAIAVCQNGSEKNELEATLKKYQAAGDQAK